MSFKTAIGFSIIRKAIAVFFVLFCLGLILYFRWRNQAIPNKSIVQLDQILQNLIDSLKAIGEPKIIYPFNPNFISDQRGYYLDLSPQQIDRLHAYRKQGKWTNSVSDFKRVTGVDSTWLSIYSSFFNFPVHVKKQPKKTFKKTYTLIDLNTTTKEELQKIYGIGEVLSQRIIQYRKRLQGFTEKGQLAEVYG